MSRMIGLMKAFGTDEAGEAVVEYAMLAALILVALVSALRQIL